MTPPAADFRRPMPLVLAGQPMLSRRKGNFADRLVTIGDACRLQLIGRGRQLNAANSSCNAVSWLPFTEFGTRIGVETPVSRHASTPLRILAAGPKRVLSASQRSVRYFVISSGRF